jgi:hypothetical protein
MAKKMEVIPLDMFIALFSIGFRKNFRYILALAADYPDFCGPIREIIFQQIDNQIRWLRTELLP